MKTMETYKRNKNHLNVPVRTLCRIHVEQDWKGSRDASVQLKQWCLDRCSWLPHGVSCKYEDENGYYEELCNTRP